MTAKLCCLITLCFAAITSGAQPYAQDTLRITIIEENKKFQPDTATIEICPTNGNWLRVDAFVRDHHIIRYMHRHRVRKFMKKFHDITTNWRDCDFCPMSTITVEGHGETLIKRSPAVFSKPKKLRRILKIWK